MPTVVKPKATDDKHDFVVIPSDQVRVAPSDAEITDLLRAAARHQSEGTRAANDSSRALSVPAVDTTFRATAVNDDVPARKSSSFGRRAIRAVAALLLTLGIGAAALSWQTFGYAAKKALLSWAPKWAIAASLPLDKLGLAAESAPSDEPAGATPATTAASDQSPSDNGTPGNGTSGNAAATAAASASDTAQQLQSMARDLANANQQVETLKASIAELKASQQQMTRDLAKVSEQAAKAKVAAATPHPPAHKPAPLYPSTTTYAPAAAPPPPAYRPVSSSYPATQTAAAPAAQPYVPPPPVQLQPEPGLASAPRPPMPVQ